MPSTFAQGKIGNQKIYAKHCLTLSWGL